MIPADPVDCFFYVLVCGFSGFCIDHMNIVISKDLLRVIFQLICVKYQDYRTFFISLVIG